MRWLNRPQSASEGHFKIVQIDDGVRPFQRQDEADGGIRRRIVLPQLDVLFQVGLGEYLAHFARRFHRLVPSELPLRLGPGNLGRMPAGEQAPLRDIAADLRGDAEPHFTPPHLR